MLLLDKEVTRSLCRMGETAVATFGKCLLPQWIIETSVGMSNGGGRGGKGEGCCFEPDHLGDICEIATCIVSWQ